MKVFVTGGGGYIGSVLIPKLLSAGLSVHVLDNFLYKQNSLASVCSNKNFKITRGDVRDDRLVKELVSNADVIIPLAALVGAPICAIDPVGAQTINHDSIISLFKSLSKSQIVLMPTTNSAYGTGDENNYCTEESELKPISKYAIDKVEIEKKLLERENSISFRLATVFGMSPRMRTDLLVNDFTYRAVVDRFIVLFEGSFRRNYVHVSDVANVFLHGINQFSSMRGNIYNVGLSSANISKKELCALINKQVPDFVYIEAPIGKDPDQRNYIVSNEKIEKTGFKTKVSLEDGIEELIKGYQSIRNTIYSNI